MPESPPASDADGRPVPDEPVGGVLVVGSISADLTVFTSRLPQPGETVIGNGFSLVLGGKGANQAIAAARAGAQVRMVGCVGDDMFAGLVTAGLEDADVDTRHVRVVEGQTGIAHIRVDADGENDIVVAPLANAALGTTQVDAAIAGGAGRVGVLLTQLEIPLAVAAHAIGRAHEAGIRVVLDPAPAHELDPAVWPMVDVVTPNETEARLLTGVEVHDRASAAAAGRWFVERGVRTAVVTLAGAGCVCVTAGSVTAVEPIEVDVVDTTAAGDAFAGYLAAALAAGASVPDAIARAAAAGALAVTVRGASPSIPTTDRVDGLLDELRH